ncbi:MAG TPA: WYL domain-containing protein [Acidimicrobiales bacterium]|nr:WYL domain-containing protein [Acidimicrobiales bacterium]
MRASRLIALLLHLRSAGTGGATAATLAAALEVSERTIYRDVSALQEAGVPVWTESGPGGGIRLLDGWRSTLDGITGAEASALLVGGGAVAAELGLGEVVAVAQAKVLTALPPELRARAARVRERFHLDAPSWFARPDAVPHLATVADAVWSERRLDVRYRRGDGTEVRRRLDPLGLVLKAGTWYLVAAHRAAPRSYRVGRLVGVATRADPVVRPARFDLAAWWTAAGAEFDRSLLRSRVRLRLSPAAAHLLGHLVDPAAAAAALAGAAPADVDGWVEIDLAVESDDVAAGQLVALGAGVEVLAPTSVRMALAATGAAMAARNTTPSPPSRPRASQS